MHTLKEILAEPQTMYNGGIVQHMSEGGQSENEDEGIMSLSTAGDIAYNLVSFLPGIGDAIDIKEFYESATKEGGPDYTGMGIAALGLVPYVGDVAQAGIRGARAAFKTIDEVPKAKLADETLSVEELSKQISVQSGDFKAPRKPELQEAVTKLETGEITGKQYRKLAKKELPINPINEVPELDSFEKISAVLKKDQRVSGIVGFNRNIKQGTRVLSRLDIPAYNKYDTWVVTLTDKSQNVRTMYGKTAVLKNVEFKPHTTPSLKVAKGKRKEPFATMEGDWQNISPEDTRQYVIDNNILEKSLDPNNEEWIQVGFNPERHGFFYTKSGKNVGQPVFDAEEIIQIGGLVLARNAKKPNLTQLKKLKIKTTPEGVSRVFNKGGQVRPMYDGGVVYMQDGGKPQNKIPVPKVLKTALELGVKKHPVSMIVRALTNRMSEKEIGNIIKILKDTPAHKLFGLKQSGSQSLQKLVNDFTNRLQTQRHLQNVDRLYENVRVDPRRTIRTKLPKAKLMYDGGLV